MTVSTSSSIDISSISFFYYDFSLFLLHEACHNYLLNKGEKLPIFYYITIRKLLLVILHYPLLLRSFIRFSRIRALTLLIYNIYSSFVSFILFLSSIVGDEGDPRV